MQTPKLHILYAYPLDRNRRELFEQKNLGEYPSMEEIKKRIEAWKHLWASVNAHDRIFVRLYEITGVQLPRDLEMYVFGGGLKCMSHPFLMPITDKVGNRRSDDAFVELTIHEIAHRFVGNEENNPGIAEYWRKIREEYAAEPVRTQNHIVLYAILETLYAEVFGTERLGEFMRHHNPEYQRAIAIVRERGVQILINQFRSFIK